MQAFDVFSVRADVGQSAQWQARDDAMLEQRRVNHTSSHVQVEGTIQFLTLRSRREFGVHGQVSQAFARETERLRV